MLEREVWKSSHWGQAMEEFVCPAHKEAKGALTVSGSVLSYCLQSASVVAMKETLLAGEFLEDEEDPPLHVFHVKSTTIPLCSSQSQVTSLHIAPS